MNNLVVVTWGSHGIGEAVAVKFLENGYNVVVIDKNIGTIAGVTYLQADVGNIDQLTAVCDKVFAMGQIKALINNVGVNNGGLDSCSYQTFMATYAVNVGCSYYLVNRLRENIAVGGSIINISSTRSAMSQANTESYSAAKGAIVSLTHAMAMTLRGKVRVNCISPGWIDTVNYPATESDNAQHTVNRVGKPRDIANMAWYLVSDDASFINGQNIVVDGGMTTQMIYHGDEGWSFNAK